MALDSMGTAAGKAKKDRQVYYADGSHDPWGVGNKGFLVDPPRLTANSDRADIEEKTFHSAPDPRHMGKANVAFCDGHVELKTLDDLGYLVQADGKVLETGAGATNKYFSGTGQDDDPPSNQ